eukprot:1671898-Pleurochrysis_carterae.AAC.1
MQAPRSAPCTARLTLPGACMLGEALMNQEGGRRGGRGGRDRLALRHTRACPTELRLIRAAAAAVQND